jgi:DNA repair protein RadA/Sms
MQFDFDNINIKLGTNILEIDVPEQLEKTYSTGMDFIDDAFGGKGMTPSTACLFTGTPGAGKTTLMMQLANAITKSGNVALFNTAEESLYQIRKVAKRLRLKYGFICGSERMVDELINNAKKIQEKDPSKQLFIIADSLQTLDDGKYANGTINSMTQVRCLEKLCQFAKDTYAIIIVIGQVNKNGELAGKQVLKHMIDAHCHLYVDTDRRSETYGERLFEVQKNRFGCSGIEYVLNMSAHGFKERIFS